MKVVGKLALDTNAVIPYREGISDVCKLVDEEEGMTDRINLQSGITLSVYNGKYIII